MAQSGRSAGRIACASKELRSIWRSATSLQDLTTFFVACYGNDLCKWPGYQVIRPLEAAAAAMVTGTPANTAAAAAAAATSGAAGANAAAQGAVPSEQLVGQLLIIPRALREAGAKNVQLALHFAAAAGSVAMTRAALRLEGADMYHRPQEHMHSVRAGVTALEVALQAENLDVARLHLGSGYDLSRPEEAKRALEAAATRGQEQHVLESVIAAGADPQRYGHAALHVAADSNNTELVQALINVGAVHAAMRAGYAHCVMVAACESDLMNLFDAVHVAGYDIGDESGRQLLECAMPGGAVEHTLWEMGFG